MLTRKRVPELMDDPLIDPDEHHQALTELARLNFITSSADIIWSQIRHLKSRPVRVLDLATGGGDIPIALIGKAYKEQIPIEILATDASNTAVSYAEQKASKELDMLGERFKLRFETVDVLKDDLPNGFDAVTCSLFTHHLDPPEVKLLMGKMYKSAEHLVLINDLVRSEMSYWLVWLGTRLFSRSPVVRYDGPVSVNASYTTQEMYEMAQSAGLTDLSVKFHPPCRQLLVSRKTKL